MPEQLTFLDSSIPQAPVIPPRTAPVPRQTAAELRTATIRQHSAIAMQCRNCGRDLWITASNYLVCSDTDNSCSKLLSLNSAKSLARPAGRRYVSAEEFRAAWPERVICSRPKE